MDPGQLCEVTNRPGSEAISTSYRLAVFPYITDQLNAAELVFQVQRLGAGSVEPVRLDLAASLSVEDMYHAVLL